MASRKQAAAAVVPVEETSSIPVKERLPLRVRSPQEEPLVLRDAAGNVQLALKVDIARLRNRQLEMHGWLVGDAQLAIRSAGQNLDIKTVRRKRPDVARALSRSEESSGFGFEVTAPRCRATATLQIRFTLDGARRNYEFDLQIEREAGATVANNAAALGFIEAAMISPLTGDGVVVGWAVQEPGTRVWLENEWGDQFVPTEPYRVDRPDVAELHSPAFGSSAKRAGFVTRVSGTMPGEKMRLLAQKAGEPTVLCEFVCASLPVDLLSASRWLLNISTPLTRLAERVNYLDGSVLQPILQKDRQGWADLPVTIHELGHAIAKPLVSIIVPLYGRHDFVEHQLMEFARDPWLCEHAEVLYVIDDPLLVDRMLSDAPSFHGLYKFPFKIVWGSTNRGFSGANNLGADHARGSYLLFLNSDVFPQDQGWLKQMVDELASRKKFGAMGARLTHGDGSIQHAGMEFVFREDLGIWTNHHPRVGLDPALDPLRQLTEVPAVTGACMLIRREQFDLVGGWDTGYLVGDFEDSDLCLKLRDAGYKIGYLPSVQLTHLERQSFKLLGEGDFRTRVVIYNAVRHQQRWPQFLPTEPQEVAK
jgi:GT2 family glycosyltransferase